MELKIIEPNPALLLIRYSITFCLIASGILIVFYESNVLFPKIIFFTSLILYLIFRHIFNIHKTLGSIVLKEDELTITDNNNNPINLTINAIKSIKIYKSGYKGEFHNFNFSTSGQLATKSGANKIFLFTKNGENIQRTFLVDDEKLFKKLEMQMNIYQQMGVEVVYLKYKPFEI
jgi:hypothetical protein